MQHLRSFLLECATVTADGSHSTLDEFEGLYVYWCSLRGEEPLDTALALRELAPHGIGPVTYDGVEYVEGLVLTGPLMTDFIASCDFSGAWGHADPIGLGVRRQVSSA